MSNQRFFQYLAGERAGEILVFDKIEEEDGMLFISFKDGSRCNEELILPLNERKWSTQLMAEIEDPKNCWSFKEEWIGRQEERQELDADGKMQIVQPFLEGKRKITPVPPKPTKSLFGSIAETTRKDNIPENPPVNGDVQKDINDPVWLMMDKAKKFDTEVEMTLLVSLPSKSLYEVAKESFDEGGDKVIEYILSNLDDKKLKDSLRHALKIAYGDTDPEDPKEIGIFEPEAIEEPVIGDPVPLKNK
jgi:hypothetical protein